MFEVGVEFFLETANLSGPVEGGVESEKSKEQPQRADRATIDLDWGVVMWFGLCLKIFVDQILGSKEPAVLVFCTADGVNFQGISFVAKISDGEVVGRMPREDFRLGNIMNHLDPIPDPKVRTTSSPFVGVIFGVAKMLGQGGEKRTPVSENAWIMVL